VCGAMGGATWAWAGRGLHQPAQALAPPPTSSTPVPCPQAPAALDLLGGRLQGEPGAFNLLIPSNSTLYDTADAYSLQPGERNGRRTPLVDGASPANMASLGMALQQAGAVVGLAWPPVAAPSPCPLELFPDPSAAEAEGTAEEQLLGLVAAHPAQRTQPRGIEDAMAAAVAAVRAARPPPQPHRLTPTLPRPSARRWARSGRSWRAPCPAHWARQGRLQPWTLASWPASGCTHPPAATYADGRLASAWQLSQALAERVQAAPGMVAAAAWCGWGGMRRTSARPSRCTPAPWRCWATTACAPPSPPSSSRTTPTTWQPCRGSTGR
jgi:hypothetical protein